jgi:hypothetical protein
MEQVAAIQSSRGESSVRFLVRASDKVPLKILREMVKDRTRLYMYSDFKDLGKYGKIVKAFKRLEAISAIAGIPSYPKCYRVVIKPLA